jgi:hypothetical protein
MPSLQQAWRRYRRMRGPTGELITFVLSLAAGLLLVPALIWLVGSRTLGPYVNGGLPSLWRDYWSALAAGSLPYWLVALGPYAAVWVWRLLRGRLLR